MTYVSAQSKIENANDSVFLGTTIGYSSFLESILDSSALEEKITIADSMKFKKLCNSIRAKSLNLLYDDKTFNDFLSTVENIRNIRNIRFKPLPRQFFYFSIHDYSSGWNLSRVSRVEHPFFDNPKDLHFLWSGHVKPYKEVGFSQEFFNSDQEGAVLIYFERGKK